MEVLRRKGSIGVFISKLLPLARTLISIPATDDFYEFHQVYHQFPDGSGAVESHIYRGRIFLGDSVWSLLA